MVTEFTIIGNLKIFTNDRISIFGRTGTGKTFLVKNFLLPHYDNYVFWDIKKENSDIIHDILVTSPIQLKKSLKSPENKKILYQPDVPTSTDFNSVCEVIFNNRNTTLYVDEAALISTPSIIQYYHRVIMTQGRSVDVGIINTSQRPRDINNTLISESEHLFVFSLNLETDIIKVRQQMGDAADEIRYLPEHHFIYYSVRTNKSFIFKPIKPYTIQKVDYKEVIKVQPLEIYRPTLEEYMSLTM